MAMEMEVRSKKQSVMSGRFLLVYVIAATLVLVALCSYSVSGIRGTDQYWYIADTEALMRNDPPVTNFRFPGMLLRGNTSDPITHFVHNGPVLHVNSYLANFLEISAASAWELSNLVWWVGAAIVLFFVLRNIVALNMAALGALMFLTTPIVVWQSANYLQEMWLGVLASIFLYYSCNLRADKKSNWWLPVFIVIGAFSHPFFVLSAVYLICASVIYRKHYSFTILLCATLLSAMLLKGSIFPSSFPPDLNSIVTSAIPGKTNLHWQFDDNPIPISAELIGSKLVEALKTQFFSVATAPMTVVPNLGMVCVLLLLILRRFRLNRVLCFALFSIGAWWAMIVLLQNQPRYQLMILPVLTVCIVLVLAQLLKQKTAVKLLVLCTVCFFLADIYLLSRVRSDTQEEDDKRQAASVALSAVSPGARFAVVDENRGLTKLIISQLSPSEGLMVDPRYIQKDHLAEVWALFKPEFLITSMARADLPKSLSSHLTTLYERPANEESSMGGSLLTVYMVESR